MKKIIILIIFIISSAGLSEAGLNVRSIGMGGVCSPTSKDPSVIFYNPSYLAYSDAIRFSFDNLGNDALMPKDNFALNIGDTGFSSCVFPNGSVFNITQAFKTSSVINLGLGLNYFKDKRDYNIGFAFDYFSPFFISGALLNGDGTFLEKEGSMTIGYKPIDEDMFVGLSFTSTPSENRTLFGFEQQFQPKAFYRLGYNKDHFACGLSYGLGYFDIDLAADFAKDNSRILVGFNLFRNSENKRYNSKHTINFGAAIEGEDKFMVIEDYNIHYVESGKGHPLLLINGGIAYSHYWDPYIKELSKKFRVINVDHLGVGDSDKPKYGFEYSVEEQAELINSLMERLGIKETYIVSYCYGGSIAFYLAGKYPEKYKKVVAIEGFVKGINTLWEEGKRKGFRSIRKVKYDVEYLNSYILKDFITAKFRLDYPYYVDYMWYKVNKNILYCDLEDEVLKMKAPLLYYAGTKSWAVDFLPPTKQFIKENVKNLKYVEIEGAGHDVDRFDEKKFLKEVLEFLRE